MPPGAGPVLTLGASYEQFLYRSTGRRYIPNIKPLHLLVSEAQTQTNDASVQTDSLEIQTSATAKPRKPTVNQNPEKPVRNNSPPKSPRKVLSDRLPKGSDDKIQQHNRFQSLDEDMEAETDHAEGNKQGRIIKLNNKR